MAGPGSPTSVQSRIARPGKPLPPYWKRSFNYACSGSTAGASPTNSSSAGPPSAASCAGMHRLRSLDPPPPVIRYEHKHPGDLVHFDIKRLARIRRPGHRVTGDRRKESRGVGWEYLHIAIDDHSRIAFSAILPDQSHQSAMRFFLMARAYYARFGISTRRVLTDNGSCYNHWLFRSLLHRQHVKHRFTRPYTPRTNGKAERFIQTALREWAYARSYLHSMEREQQLDLWLHDYNFHRPHASLNLNSPASRSGLNRNNLLSLHI